tara:strand:- start:708 stop:902 length:195 start_codon:yes stop_codon:yes gene_type:complete
MLDHNINVGDKVKIVFDIPTVGGMLYKDTVVIVKGIGYPDKDVKVIDDLGKIYYINYDNITKKL